MTAHVRPSVQHNVSPSGIDYGHELTLERINDQGEHTGAFVFGELSRGDLKAIAEAIGNFLASPPIDLPQTHFPAYFVDGPRAGQSMATPGSPSRLLFNVPRDLFRGLWSMESKPWEPPPRETDEYERERAVVLYRYAGRFKS